MSCSTQSTKNQASIAAGKKSDPKGFSDKVVHQPQTGTFEPQRPGVEALAAMASTPAAVSKPNTGSVQNVRKVPDMPSAKQGTADKPVKATKVRNAASP